MTDRRRRSFEETLREQHCEILSGVRKAATASLCVMFFLVFFFKIFLLLVNNCHVFSLLCERENSMTDDEEGFSKTLRERE